MPVAFDKPVGAASDTAELCYVNCLLQTSKKIRRDATLTATDMRRHLVSRHGLRITEGAASFLLLSELAGTANLELEEMASEQDEYKKMNTSFAEEEQRDSEEDVPVMDLVQMVALLIIPELQLLRRESTEKEEAKEDSQGETITLIQFVLNLLQERLKCPEGIILSQSSLHELLKVFGEDELWDEDDISEMLAHVGIRDEEKTAVLDQEAFLRALTADTDHFPVERQDFLSTHYQDALYSKTLQTERLPPPAYPERGTSKKYSRLRHAQDISLGVISASTQVVANSTTIAVGAFKKGLDSAQGALNTHLPQIGSTVEQVTAATGVAMQTSKDAAQKISRAVIDNAQQKMDEIRNPSWIGGYERIFTLASNDQAVDTYRTLTWSTLSWFTLVLVYFAYFVGGSGAAETTLPQLECGRDDSYEITEFGCEAVNGIVRWLSVFLELSLLGTTFMILSQLGNNAYALEQKRKWVVFLFSLLGIWVVFFSTVLSYMYHVRTNLFDTGNERGPLTLIAMVFGVILLANQFGQLCRIFVPLEKYPRLRPYLVSGAHKLERCTKQAATRKIGSLLTNALVCHSEGHLPIRKEDQPSRGDTCDDEETRKSTVWMRMSSALLEKQGGGDRIVDVSALERALSYYHKHSEDTERYGGTFWFWRNTLASKSLSFVQEEGIWLSSRLIASNLAQWTVAILAVPVGALIGLDAIRNNETVDLYQQDFVVKESELTIALAVGAFAAFSGGVAAAVVYVPSSVSTVLKFRTGVFASINDTDGFRRYSNPEKSTVLFGASLWGAIFSVAVSWFLVGGLVFCLVWEEFRPQVKILLATLIGLCTTILLKIIILTILRQNWFAGLHRRNPGAANILHVILECWNLSLSSGYILSRTAKFLFISIFYIGRIDTPMLAEGVGTFNGTPLDGFPVAFRTDLLIHEAHRHPYIERLGLIYMIKLQHGSNFGRRGGAAWRILFVLALCPWLRKHRKRSTNEEAIEDERSATNTSLKEENTRLRMQLKRLSMQLDLSQLAGSSSAMKTDSACFEQHGAPASGAD